MDPEYDIPIDVRAPALNDSTGRDVDDNEPDLGEYVNVEGVSQPRVLVAEDEGHLYSEINKTVTVTKDTDVEGNVETQVTVVITERQQLNGTEQERVDDDVIGQRDNVTRRDNDVTSETGSLYEEVQDVTRVTDHVEKVSAHNGTEADGTVVEKLVEKEFEVERIVERILEQELEDERGPALTDRVAEDDDNIYDDVQEMRDQDRSGRDQERTYAVESLEAAAAHRQVASLEDEEEEALYDDASTAVHTYSTLEQNRPDMNETRDSEESLEAPAAVSAYSVVEPTTQDTHPAQKTPQPTTSGKFVMRAVSRADPRHIVQCITQSSLEMSQHDPEQDELVTYLKGEAEGSELKQKLKSWIASPLIQQFNKEAESGAEVSHALMPKSVAVSAVRTAPVGGVTREVRSVTSPTQPVAPRVDPAPLPQPPQPTQISSPSSERIIAEDPRIRNAEIAKAVETADFKPTAAVSRPSVATQNGGVHQSKKADSVEQTSPTAQGVSVYARQSVVRTEPSNGTKQSMADWKSEVERRRQTKEYLTSQKPAQPLKLAEVPEWKVALMEKNKQRKSSSTESSGNPLSATVKEEAVELEWKREVQQIAKQRSMVEGAGTQAEVPEWQRIKDSSK